jgi:hypothetical protein
MKHLYQATALLISFGIPQLGHAGIIWELNSHEYELVNAEGTTWLGADTAVTTDGWYLASVTSIDENDFIVGNLLQGLSSTLAQRSHYWIGGSDAAAEGSFTWVTGEEFGYTNWWPLEHNNFNNEDFLAYDLRGTGWGWNDVANDLAIYGAPLARGYIMERVAPVQALRLAEPVSVPEPTSLLLLGTGLLCAAVVRRKRA